MSRPSVKMTGGIALIVVLIAMAVFSALGLGLILTTATDRFAGANYEDRVHAANAADAALELTIRELAAVDEWDLVLSGARTSRFVQGTAPVDLGAITNHLTCGGPSSCTDAQRQLSTADRPWGANNPAWQVFLRAPLSTFVNIPAVSADMYIVVWVGDDARETDADPLVDGGGPNDEGRGVVRARAEVFTRGETRYASEADLIRQATGIRVQSWRAESAAVP
jgi:hypothetical protein